MKKGKEIKVGREQKGEIGRKGKKMEAIGETEGEEEKETGRI